MSRISQSIEKIVPTMNQHLPAAFLQLLNPCWPQHFYHPARFASTRSLAARHVIELGVGRAPHCWSKSLGTGWPESGQRNAICYLLDTNSPSLSLSPTFICYICMCVCVFLFISKYVYSVHVLMHARICSFSGAFSLSLSLLTMLGSQWKFYCIPHPFPHIRTWPISPSILSFTLW